MNTRAVNAAAGVIARAMESGYVTPTDWASALESAQLLQSPELAAEFEHLRAQVAELEAQRERRQARLVALQNDALNIRGALSPSGEARKVPMPLDETLLPAVEWLINRVAELEAERHSTNEALADVTVALRGAHEETDPGACQGCGSLPEQWCPDCAACEKGCFGGFDGNECTHGNAPWRRPSAAESADRLTRLLAPTQALLEDPHDSPLHHRYALGRDLPPLGGAS